MAQASQHKHQLRNMLPGDYEIFCQWWKRHGHVEIPRAIIPGETTFVLCDEKGPVAALVAYLAVNIGVMNAKFIVSRPSLTMKESRNVFKILLEGVKASVKPLNYNTIIADVVPSLGREMKRLGFSEWSNVLYVLQF